MQRLTSSTSQRAVLQNTLPILGILDPKTGVIRESAVVTVERFGGGERNAIPVSVTENDCDFLLQTGSFLIGPRRLTVALGRSKQKMVLMFSRSVFNLFSTDIVQNQEVATSCNDLSS